MNAFSLIRKDPWYRHDAFVSGLKSAGHTFYKNRPNKFDKDSLLVIWNRYSDNHNLASQVEQAGGRVLVAENGYVGTGGGTPKFQVHPKGGHEGHYYALTEGWHNGGAPWKAGETDRWSRLGVEIKPWRQSGKYILVCPNRSFGVPGRSMPEGWAEKMAERMKPESGLPIKIRRHPGNDQPKHSLSDDLAEAAAVVVWTSSCGVHSLIEGIPTICEAPYWICKQAAPTWAQVLAGGDDLSGARVDALNRLAWAQWTVEEIANGDAFRFLLS